MSDSLLDVECSLTCRCLRKAGLRGDNLERDVINVCLSKDFPVKGLKVIYVFIPPFYRDPKVRGSYLPLE
jgi:hypothetical protein